MSTALRFPLHLHGFIAISMLLLSSAIDAADARKTPPPPVYLAECAACHAGEELQPGNPCIRRRDRNTCIERSRACRHTQAICRNFAETWPQPNDDARNPAIAHDDV